jgi:hypothetical protein
MEGPQYKERSGWESTDRSPGRFEAHTERISRYEKVQPSLVAAWRRSAVGGDRLQSTRHQLLSGLWDAGRDGYAWLRRAGHERRSNDLFAGHVVLPRRGRIERLARIVVSDLVWLQFWHAEHVLVAVVGTWSESLTSSTVSRAALRSASRLTEIIGQPRLPSPYRVMV